MDGFFWYSSVSHILLAYSSPACLRHSKCWHFTPTMWAPLFFMLMTDFWTITSGILPNSTLFKAAMFWCLQVEVRTLSLPCTPKETNHMGWSHVSRGRGPMCPHSSTNWWQASCPGRWCHGAIRSPSWPGVAWPHLAATQFILPQGLLHDREDLVLQQLPVAELVDPQ